MNEPSLTPTPLTQESQPFPSFESLRKAHTDLMKQHRESGSNPEIAAAIVNFIQRGNKLGAVMDNESDREAAQSLLDYWVTRLYRFDQATPDATLEDFDPSLAPDIPDELCPYLGLDAFNEAQGNLLFGRRKLLEGLIRHLKGNRLLAVAGPSGSGKSSLVRAGLIPALKASRPEGQTIHYFAPILPGSAPLQNLALLLQPCSPEPSAAPQAEVLLQNPQYLADWIERCMGCNVVVVVDQFEEVFTLCDDPSVRQVFVNNLVGLLKDPRRQHIVILTLRTDFESQVARLSDFQPLFEAALVRVTPLNASELREAIEAPARLIGLKFEDGVVNALLNDILGEPAALPLLQFTLLKLWEHREHNRVTWETYHRLGGGRMALARSADEFYNDLIPEEQITARRILLRLVRPGEGLEVTSYRMRRANLYLKAEAADRIDRVLEKCVQARLLRLTHGNTPADDQVEVAHEALVRNWPTLIGWLDDERVLLRERQRLTVAAEHWRSLGKDPSALLRGVLLREAEHYDDLNELETAFIHASQTVLEAEEAQKEAARQRELADARRITEEAEARRAAESARAQEAEQAAVVLRRRNRVITAIGTVAVVLAGTAVVLFLLASAAQQNADTQRIAADAQRGTAVSEAAMRATAQGAAEVQKGVAQSASTEAVAQKSLAEAASTQAVAQQIIAEAASTQAVAQQVTAEAASTQAVYQSQLAATQEAIAKQQSLIANSRQLAARALNYLNTQSDLSLLLSVEAYKAQNTHEALSTLLLGLQRVLRRTTLLASVPIYGTTNEVGSIAFDPSGTLLMLGNQDGTLTLRNVSQQAILDSPLFRHTEKITAIQWSPDRQHIATASTDGSAIIYNIPQKSFRSIFSGDTAVWSLAFSPDGSKLAVGRDSGEVTVWDVKSWDVNKIQSFKDQKIHTGHVYGVAWSPDGKQIASVGSDRIVRVWKAETGEFVHLLSGHTGRINGVDWSPDGKLIASCSDDKTIILWDAIYGRKIATLAGHTAFINSVRFSPDSKLLASASGDGTVILWDANLFRPIDQLDDARTVVLSAIFSPDGKTLASNSGGSVNLWKIFTEPALGQLYLGQVGAVQAIVAQNDNVVVLANDTQSLALWDLNGQQQLASMRRAKYASYWLSPYDQGKTLVTGDSLGKIIIWNTGSNEASFTLDTQTHSPITAVALNPAGKILAWRACTDPSPNQVCVSGPIQLWDVVSNQAIGKPFASSSGAVALAFNADSTLLASVNTDSSIVIWNMATGEPLGLPLFGPSRFVTPYASIAFSPDDQFLASTSVDGSVVLWDLNSGQQIGEPFPMPGVTSLSFVQSGTPMLAAGSSDGTAVLWDMNPASWLERACQAAGRNFSQAEWAQFFPDQPYRQTCTQWPEGK